MRKTFLQLLVLSGMLVSIPFTSQAEELRLGGGGAALAALIEPVLPYFEKASGLTVSRRPATSIEALIDLYNGKTELAVSANPIEAMLAGAAKAGVTIDPGKLYTEQVGVNKTVLFVHPANKVNKLTREQLTGIFSGKIGNWKDVGGDDKPIIVVWALTTGQNNHFSNAVLGGTPVTKDALSATNYAAIKDIIASTPEAIGIDPLALADPTVKAIASDPELTEPIIAVTVGKPSVKVQKLLDYIKGEGRKYTKQ